MKESGLNKRKDTRKKIRRKTVQEMKMKKNWGAENLHAIKARFTVGGEGRDIYTSVLISFQLGQVN